MLYIWRSHLWTHLGIAAAMPTMKAELERLVEELQKKLEKTQQFKGSIETAFQASMTSQFEEELARVVAAERKRSNVV